MVLLAVRQESNFEREARVKSVGGLYWNSSILGVIARFCLTVKGRGCLEGGKREWWRGAKGGRKGASTRIGEGAERQCRTLRSFLNELRIELIFSGDARIGDGPAGEGKTNHGACLAYRTLPTSHPYVKCLSGSRVDTQSSKIFVVESS